MPQQPHAPVGSSQAGFSAAKVLPSSLETLIQTLRLLSPYGLSLPSACQATVTLPCESAVSEPPPSRTDDCVMRLRCGSNDLPPSARRVYIIGMPPIGFFGSAFIVPFQATCGRPFLPMARCP